METKSQSIIDWFARNPRVGLLGTIASIVSIPLAVILFWVSKADRDIRYAVSPSPTTIARSGQTSDLRVFFKDKELTSDVSAVQIAIWNAGKEAVRTENILSKRISLRFAPATSILLVRTKGTTRPIVDCMIDDTAIASGKFELSWNILEAGDGVLLEVFYTGTTTTVHADGTIEGQNPISIVPVGASRDIMTDQQLGWILGVSVGFSVLLAIAYWRSEAKARGWDIVRLLVASSLFSLMALALLSSLFIHLHTPTPPFSF